jgi:outer membrane protein TolC
VYAIDLVTALGLAGAENPTIALAREAVAASRADLLRARALLLPTLNAGSSIDVHRGNLQTSQGQIISVDRQALFVGAGASAVGAGTVTIPGVRLTAQLAEAVFEPRAARQQVAASSFDALAVRNRVLLDVTDAYFALLGAEGRLQALRQAEADLGEVVRLAVNFARAGEGREADADRARSEALLLHTREEAAEGEVAAAAANLARLLNLDPSVRLRGPGGPLPLVRLVDPSPGLEALIQVALGNRPEVAARTADVGVVTAHLRQEQVRPFVPLLSVGYSAGEFGGGSNLTDTRFGHFDGRSDFDALAVWSLENFGVGNLNTVRRLRAEVTEAAAVRARAMEQIRREVAYAYAVSAARIQQLEVARRRVETSEQAYRLDLERIRGLVGVGRIRRVIAHPIELMNSADLLNRARLDLIAAMVGFDQAQFGLFVALGQPPTEATPLVNGRPCLP